MSDAVLCLSCLGPCHAHLLCSLTAWYDLVLACQLRVLLCVRVAPPPASVQCLRHSHPVHRCCYVTRPRPPPLQALDVIGMSLPELVESQAGRMRGCPNKQQHFLEVLLVAGASGRIPELQGWAALRAPPSGLDAGCIALMPLI